MADISVGVPNEASGAKAAVRAAIPAYNAAMDDLTTNWSGLTTGQKSEALRTMLILVAKVCRWLVMKELKL